MLCILWSLTLSWLATGVLVCNFSPLQDRNKPSMNSTTECLPEQRCYSARARYGPVHVLSAQGCVAADLCGSSKIIRHRGHVDVNVSYTCCCGERCNPLPTPETALMRLLGATLVPVIVATNGTIIPIATPNPLGLCPENSTAVPVQDV
ncbi:hypothetical protein ACEWY4_011272 [Coilia grayii]|uniref:Uncharacterized protein n=1 Tax=Coilia grayii TaxID=363190 RepID=A0ABD1K4A6_9TELE